MGLWGVVCSLAVTGTAGPVKTKAYKNPSFQSRANEGAVIQVFENRREVHSDLWALNLNDHKWDKIKKAGMPPGPRAGFSLAGARAPRTP
eukprot:5198513-Pyramimonas_sp.AAC.1